MKLPYFFIYAKDKKQTSTDLTAVLLHDDMKLGIFRDIKKEEIVDSLNALIACLQA